jgi:hypothetical protein
MSLHRRDAEMQRKNLKARLESAEVAEVAEG